MLFDALPKVVHMHKIILKFLRNRFVTWCDRHLDDIDPDEHVKRVVAGQALEEAGQRVTPGHGAVLDVRGSGILYTFTDPCKQTP